MLVLGVDPSSSCTGLALVRGEELVSHAVWTPPKRATRPAGLLDYRKSMSDWIEVVRLRTFDHGELGPLPDLAVVEELSVTRGWKTVRALAHFEAITYLVLEEFGIPIKTVKPGAARNWVLDMKITSSKEDVHAEVRRRWPDLKLPPVNRGGGDVADAYVVALAAPEILRRGS